jgi:dihydroorotase
MKEVIIRSPDDMHFHPRSGKMLEDVLLETSKVFSRGVVMGNLPSPVVTADDAEAYRREILGVDGIFSPIMTIMLTKRTTPQVIEEASKRGLRVLKYIPNNVSTNSAEGVALNELETYYPVLEMAQELGMIFSGHWESPFDRSGFPVAEVEREGEAIRFLDRVVKNFPTLKIVVEHASTEKMIEYVEGAPANVGATLTVHHALLIYNSVCDESGKIYNPYNYCKPIAKKFSDRKAVTKAMISGNPKFFFGSDSAPHPMVAKIKTPPAAGIFTAPVVLPLLCEIFESSNALFRLEEFVSRFGAEFYGLPLNQGKIVLKREGWIVPEFVSETRVFRGGHMIDWQVESR